MSRISRAEMLSQIVSIVAQRSTCKRKHVGAILVREGRILSIGYGGAPPGAPHCEDAGCLIDPSTGGCIRTQHAEANLIAFAAKNGIVTENSTLWCTLSPCLPCAKLILSAGIVTVNYLEKYRDVSGISFLEENHVVTYHHESKSAL